jgi:hypothetical protein
MRRLVLVAALGLAGCQTSTENAILSVAIPQVAAANNTLAKLDPTIKQACVRVAQSEKWFIDAKPLILLFKKGPSIIAKEAAYTAIVDKICAHPPANVVEAFNQLNAAWQQIQALTTIPKA